MANMAARDGHMNGKWKASPVRFYTLVDALGSFDVLINRNEYYMYISLDCSLS